MPPPHLAAPAFNKRELEKGVDSSPERAFLNRRTLRRSLFFFLFRLLASDVKIHRPRRRREEETVTEDETTRGPAGCGERWAQVGSVWAEDLRLRDSEKRQDSSKSLKMRGVLRYGRLYGHQFG